MKDKVIDFFAKYKYHVLAWSVYIIYESVVTGLFAGVFGPLINYVVHYSLNIVLFYVNAIFISRIRIKGGNIEYLKYPLLIIIEIFLYTIALALLNNFFTDYNQPVKGNFFGIDYKFVLGATYRSLFFIMVSSGYAFLRMFIDERKKSDLLQIKSLEDIIARRTAEANLISIQNAYLRAQVNPHLFFNVLSFVHRRIRKVDELAGDMLISLCDVMRYAADSTPTTNLIKLEDEIEQIKTLSHIFKMLHGGNFNLTILYDQQIKDIMILPLLLVTLVENMYKHGNLTNAEDPGKLHIYIDGGFLKIETTNAVLEHTSSFSLGTGLKNLSERMESTYGQKDLISSDNKDGKFTVKASILIDG
ncbi:sensor histidine kinase [Pedobacter sp. BG31]|uniref:sensor histidine kinase n=1 Tax=Pedobacter sp. BG31 TaxID=3349697 RepID=UPI0035F3A30E